MVRRSWRYHTVQLTLAEDVKRTLHESQDQNCGGRAAQRCGGGPQHQAAAARHAARTDPSEIMVTIGSSASSQMKLLKAIMIGKMSCNTKV